VPKMRFFEDKFVDGECKFTHGRIYEVPKESVERWLKRGGELVPDANASDEVTQAQLDASLAINLEREGKATPEETRAALDRAEAAKGIEPDYDDDSEEEQARKKKRKLKK
jgi:hypothetical protein